MLPDETIKIGGGEAAMIGFLEEFGSPLRLATRSCEEYDEPTQWLFERT
jgi:hypothetical protein